MSKKILMGVLLAGLVLTPVVANAVATPAPTSCEVRKLNDVKSYLDECTSSTCKYDDDTEPCALCCLMGSVLYVTDIIFVGLVIIVIVLTFVGAFFILTAGGNPENQAKGRSYIMWALIGLLVTLLARAIPNLVKFFLRPGNGTS